MAEFFQNKFVIQRDSGHPGYQSYTIIATRNDLDQMVRELTVALGEFVEAASPVLEHNSRPRQIISKYATIANGETSRVYLQFAIADDLSCFHVRPTLLSRIKANIGCITLTGLVIFAAVGVFATLGHVLAALFQYILK